MPTTTPAQAFPVPVATDDPDIPGDLMALATAIERRIVGVYATAADRNAKVSAPQEGQVAFQKDTNAFTFYDGAAWQPMFPTQVTITSGTTVPANTSGKDGDVFFKV